MNVAEKMRACVAKHGFTWTDVIEHLRERTSPAISTERIRAAVADCIEGRSCSVAVAMAIIELTVKEGKGG